MRFGIITTLPEVYRAESLLLHSQVRTYHSSSLFLELSLLILKDGQISNCPSRGIHYPLKRSQNEPTKTAPHGPGPTDPPDVPFIGRGNLMVNTLNQQRGCIISPGTWYSSGTCATFRAIKLSGL